MSKAQANSGYRAEVAVVGAGPAGIVVALELSRRGVDVILVESGEVSASPSAQALSDANSWDNAVHAPMALAVRRQVGGTSNIWGGRCVPYDPVDFEERPWMGDAQWPLGYAEISAYFQRASDWLRIGRAVFNVHEVPGAPSGIVPGLQDTDITSSTLERWSLPTNFRREYAREIASDPHLRLLTSLTCAEITSDSETGRANSLRCVTSSGVEVTISAGNFVIACGGLESTRLLLCSKGSSGGALGGDSGHLGHWYMAHLEGVVAKVHFSTPPKQTVFGFERDIDGVYIRRRFGFSRQYQFKERLPNITGWLANPELCDARHRSGPLSFVYLALSSPLGSKFAPEAQRLSLAGTRIPGAPYGDGVRTPTAGHLLNIACAPATTVRFVADFGAKRFLARNRRAPGFYVYSKNNTYPLLFHGEHAPNYNSTVKLSPNRDGVGMRKLDIDLKFSSADEAGVLAAHSHWDLYLREAGVGCLSYLDADTLGRLRQRLGGGFHQIGTTRMSSNPRSGVVDANLAVHTTPNVYVASSSTFVTSGQANSTFMIVAFATRLADYLAAGRERRT